jgi:hypothetical protein
VITFCLKELKKSAMQRPVCAALGDEMVVERRSMVGKNRV